VVEPWGEIGVHEPRVSGNFTPAVIQEKAAIKRALEAGSWLLPSHDKPARVQYGQVIGRVEGLMVPGPVTAVRDAELAKTGSA
jgi:hypothetical protein